MEIWEKDQKENSHEKDQKENSHEKDQKENSHEKDQKENSHEKDQKENSHEKVSQSLILLRTHIHIHSSRHIPHTHGHQVFIVLYCIVIKKLQQS